MASRNSLDMTTGPVFRKLLLFAYPLMISALVNTLYDAADKVIAGQFIGDNALAAVGTSTPPISLLLNTFVGIASGAGVICGNYIGGNRKQELRDCMHTAPLAGFLCGLLVCIIGLICSRPLLTAMDTPEAIFSDALTYTAIRMLGMPISLANSFCLNIFNAHGDTKRITLSGVLSGLVNVLGNLLFVIVIPLGVAGIALATVLSQLLDLSIKLVILFSPKDIYRLRFAEVRLHMQHAKRIFAIGIPTGMNSLVFSVSNVLLQSSVNSFGPVVMAGNADADAIMTFATLFPAQMNAASSCAVAQCYGAANYRRIDETVKKGILGSLLLTATASAIVTVFSKPLMGLFTDDPAVMAAGIPKLMFAIWGYLIYTFSLIYGGALKGIHKSGSMMLLNLVGVCLPRVLWVWFVFPLFATPTVLYLIYPVSYLISAALLGIVYHRNLNRLLQEHEHTANAF